MLGATDNILSFRQHTCMPVY